MLYPFAIISNTMAEGLGVAASLVTLAEVAVKLGKFIKSIRGAPSEIASLRDELDRLIPVFDRVEDICNKVPERYCFSLSTTLGRLRRNITPYMKSIICHLHEAAKQPLWFKSLTIGSPVHLSSSDLGLMQWLILI